jgi:hypothetical protein
VQALGLSLSSLRRIRLTPQSAAPRQAAWHRKNSPTWNALKQQYADLRNVIGHVRLPAPSRHIVVGIADSPIVDAYGEFAPGGIHRVVSAPLSEYRSHSDAFAYEAGAPCDLVSGCPDHGYMVASLIAARRSPLEEPGLAPHAIIVPLRRDSPDVGNDIEAAISQGMPLKIVNVSAAASAESPVALLEVIHRRRDILFVVAAGGEGKLGAKICDALAVYPACWGREDNVLVVGALTQDGTALLAGMNFGRRDVHVGAPGTGWALSTGRQAVRDAYGSSFATPIATAAAAWLRAIEPRSLAKTVKHRLMATADWEYYAAQPQRPTDLCYSDCVVAGRVHFQRAVECPAKAQFYDQQDASAECVEVLPIGNVSARYADGITRPVRLADILRATRIGNGPQFRLVQVTPAGELDIQQVTPIGKWTVIPIGGGTSRDITGYADYVAPMPSP